MKACKKIKFFLAVTVIVLAVIFISQGIVKAAGLTDLSILLIDSSGNDLSDVNAVIPTTTIAFTPSTTINSDYGITINFASDFDISKVVNSNVVITQANGGTDITKGIATVSGQDLRIPITKQSDTPDGAITVKIAGSHIKTPKTPGTYIITITTWDLGLDGVFGGIGANADTQEDTGAAAVVIGTNQINISGTVDTTLTLSLSDNTCDLGILSSIDIKTCSYSTTVSTNGQNGYSAYIKADGNLRNSANSIANVSDGDVTPATEEYGVSTTENSRSITRINDENSDGNYTQADCMASNNQGADSMNATALSTIDQTFAGSSGAVSNFTSYLCHAAGITSATPEGVYNQFVTITVVSNF